MSDLVQAIGRGSQHEDLSSLDESISRSWVEWSGHAGDFQELWRYELERVDGDWKICGARLVSSYRCPLDNAARLCEVDEGP